MRTVSPGDSISDNSEKLLQRDMGEGQDKCDFGEWRVRAIKHIFFFKMFLLVTRNRHNQQRILVLF